MFKTMLPGPLATLHFTKIDLGPVPLRLSNAKTTRTEADGIKLDMNVEWKGKADIEMDADYIPALVSAGLLPTRWMPLNRLVGRRKRAASRQAFHPAMPSDKRHTTGQYTSCPRASSLVTFNADRSRPNILRQPTSPEA